MTNDQINYTELLQEIFDRTLELENASHDLNCDLRDLLRELNIRKTANSNLQLVIARITKPFD